MTTADETIPVAHIVGGLTVRPLPEGSTVPAAAVMVACRSEFEPTRWSFRNTIDLPDEALLGALLGRSEALRRVVRLRAEAADALPSPVEEPESPRGQGDPEVAYEARQPLSDLLADLFVRGPLPAGWEPTDAIVLAQTRAEDGTEAWQLRITDGVSAEEALGVVTARIDLLRDFLLDCYTAPPKITLPRPRMFGSLLGGRT